MAHRTRRHRQQKGVDTSRVQPHYSYIEPQPLSLSLNLPIAPPQKDQAADEEKTICSGSCVIVIDLN